MCRQKVFLIMKRFAAPRHAEVEVALSRPRARTSTLLLALILLTNDGFREAVLRTKHRGASLPHSMEELIEAVVRPLAFQQI